MRRRVAFAPSIWLALAAVIALLWSSHAANAAPLLQETGAPAPAAGSLPAPLYYIDGYSDQIVRLETDGLTRRTVTYETDPVTAFDVSPDGSKLAYVSGNRLIEADANGSNPVLKFAGPALNTLDPTDFTNDRVYAPVYSPDGERVAFGFNGVNLVASGPDAGPESVNTVLPSDPFPTTFPRDEVIRFFTPRAWGPDGVHLVVDFGYYPEGGGQAILAPDSSILVDLSAEFSDIALSGDVAWKPDSTGFYIGSAALAYGTPGLSLVDAGSGVVTGILTSPVSFDGSVTPIYFVRGPHVAGDGGLLAFVAAQETIDTAGTFALEKVDPANGERAQVNGQVYPWPDSVLWARDDSGALLLTNGGSTFQWAPTDGSEPLTLPTYGSSPRWGSADFGAAPPEAAEIAALFEQSLDLAAVRESADPPPFGPSTAFPVQAADGTTYWIAHTTGLRSFDPDTPHAVGVYVRDGDGWQEVSLLQLTGLQEGVTAGPDYLNDGGVMPVQIGPAGDTTSDGTQLWLHVEGGAGAHGGVCAILRLAGDTLTQELDSFSASPGGCEIKDVNGDGANEVVLDATDPYVFCYACGVRFVDYGVQRWDGQSFTQVNLDPLPAAAPPELDSRNDELLRLVQGGLWKGALALADSPVTAGSPVLASTAVTATGAATATGTITDEGVITSDISGTVTITTSAGTTATASVTGDPSGVYASNTALVRLIGEARRADAERADHPYPLLAQVFYGDYPAAVDVMRVYSAAEIFAWPSALVSGTVAVGWESTLADRITTTTSAAIDVNPQLAAAFFVRGWGEWLGGASAWASTAGDLPPDAAPTTDVAIDDAALAAAVADIRRALELSPDPFYAASLSLLTGEEVSLPAAPVTGTQSLTTTAGVSPTATTTATTTTTTTTATGATGGAGRIFYSTVQDGVDRIYSLEFGAQNATLTEVLDQARQPSLQPGGVRLAYQSTRDDMLGLGGFDLDTGSRFNFTTNLEDSLPRWNPEGNRLAFSSTRYGDGRSRVYLAWAQDAESATEEALDLGEGSDPDWSPDGARLVYKGCDETGANCGLWTTAIDGTDRRQLTDNAGDARPRWSPDGSRVVFMSDGRDGNMDIYSVLVDSGEVTRISFNAASDGLPAVSPDGSEIVFVSNRGNQWGIWRVGVESGRAESVVGDLGALTNWLDHSLDWVP